MVPTANPLLAKLARSNRLKLPKNRLDRPRPNGLRSCWGQPTECCGRSPVPVSCNGSVADTKHDRENGVAVASGPGICIGRRERDGKHQGSDQEHRIVFHGNLVLVRLVAPGEETELGTPPVC